MIVTTELDSETLSATQDGKALTSQRLGDKRFSIDVNPTLGRVLLRGE